jgi:hypothetical protein
VQPGSSIMPGKVNPSVPEMVNQVCFQVIGCDAAILAAADAGQLELNVMMPVIAWNAVHATRILARAMHVLQARSVSGIVADEERCRELLDRSTAVATALSPYIGYAATADIAKTSVRTGTPVRDLVRERKLLPADLQELILSPEGMTSPGIPGQAKGPDDESNVGSGAGDRAGADPRGAGSPRRAAARPAVPAGTAGAPRRARSGRVAAAGTGDGRAANRRRQRRR